MRYCTKCGAEIDDNQELCANCAQQQAEIASQVATPDTVEMTTATAAESMPKSIKVGIMLLLLSSVLLVVFNALHYFVTNVLVDNTTIAKAILATLVHEYPHFADHLQYWTESDVVELIYFVQINLTLLRLVPLFWIVPMRKKILQAMKNGTKLSKGFKHCTWIFVNFFAGIILLGREDI